MSIHITECPRDAMQGIKGFIPTTDKIRYINSLLKVGFNTIDFGSFVSPKAIPQMRDTAEVLRGIDLSHSQSNLLAIIANERGASDACSFDEISFLGYPFSISETFQMRNTNATIEQSLAHVEAIQTMCSKHNKRLLIYISMAFGNPYGDPWSAELAGYWVGQLNEKTGVQHFALADTVGIGSTERIRQMFSTLLPNFPHLEIGSHFHSKPQEVGEKACAAYESGCRRFDAAIKGLGGCPMAEDDLVGNMDTELLVTALPTSELSHIHMDNLALSSKIAGEIFPL